MNDFTQSMVDGCDKTTVDGFAEALCICIGSLQNNDGLFVRAILGDTMEEQIDYCKQIATRMLKAREQ